MAELVFTDVDFTITTSTGTIDLSDHVRSAQLTYQSELQDKTAMQGNGTRSRINGLKDWNVSAEMNQDFAAGSVDATLFALIGSTAVTLTLRPDGTASRGATNPDYQGSAVLESYEPIGNGVGELATVNASFQAAGSLSRLTSST